MHRITVVISTNCKRPQKLLECLASIKKSTYTSYNVIVLQQSVRLMQLPQWVKTWKIPLKGVSFSKNTAIQACNTEFIAFTDDDCLVDPRWLERVVDALADSSIDGVYGRVIPYVATRRVGYRCPSYMLKTKKEIINSFALDRTHFGIGCNMAFRTNTLKAMGGFKKWLGPGAIGLAAEDVELLFRLLQHHNSLLYDPDSIIYHNRWLSKDDNRKQYYKYFCGMLAAYSFHMNRGDMWAAKVVKQFWKRRITSLFETLFHSRIHPMTTAMECFYGLIDISYYMRGMAIGVYYSVFNGRTLSHTV